MHDKELMWLPVLSAIATLIAIAGVSGIGYAGGVFPDVTDAEGNPKPLGIALGLLMYVALAFVALFFNAAMVAGATERLKGGDPTVGSALKAAAKKAGRIFVWSLVVATVNIILQAIRERSNFLGQMLASFAGMAWNLATYFMVPILLFENEGIGGSVKRSGSLFKKTWGETVAGDAGLGLVATIATMVTAFVGFLIVSMLASLGVAALVTGIVLAVLMVALVVVLFAALQGVYKAALYRYATSGQVGMGFETSDIAGAFHAKAT